MKVMILCLFAVLLLVACSQQPAAPAPVLPQQPIVNDQPPVQEPQGNPPAGKAQILSSAIEPNALTIRAGQTITFSNDDERGIPHIVRCKTPDGYITSPRLMPGEKYDATFPNPGTFECVDTIMKFKATVTVE
ncbi:hypothetical protein J4464_04395 [Candidatus Woesearchaeota archaeon]|nr:hypothetical protein [Candidatus Woesearchaeota archaeon]